MAKSVDDLLASATEKAAETYEDTVVDLLMATVMAELSELNPKLGVESGRKARAVCLRAVALGACYREIDRLICLSSMRDMKIVGVEAAVKLINVDKEYREMARLGRVAAAKLFAAAEKDWEGGE